MVGKFVEREEPLVGAQSEESVLLALDHTSGIVDTTSVCRALSRIKLLDFDEQVGGF